MANGSRPTNALSANLRSSILDARGGSRSYRSIEQHRQHSREEEEEEEEEGKEEEEEKEEVKRKGGGRCEYRRRESVGRRRAKVEAGEAKVEVEAVVVGRKGERRGATTGRLDRRMDGWKDRQDWRPLITGGACARNAAARLSPIQ